MPGRWYHRNINGVQAEKLLQEYGQDGSFLIRPSQSTVNSYTLSVRCGDDFKHVKIQNNGDCYEIGEGGDKFATLAELVEHFIMKESLRDKSDGTVLVLRYPLSYKEPTTERYFHGAISGAEASNLLMTKGKAGSYLVRESRTHPEDYVLCVRCDNDKIVHLIIQYTPKGYHMHNFDKYSPTLDEFINECIKMCPIVDVRDNVVFLKQPLNSSRVNAINLNTRVTELERLSKTRFKNGFSEEFESLQQVESQFLHERKDGYKPENRAKNRFKTILPFDRNRVKLLGRTNNPDDPVTSDYINANRIVPEEKIGKTYLATQGPLPNTIADFWHMIWQEGCQIILMITHEEEKGRVKCSRYWPEVSGAVENNYVNLELPSRVSSTSSNMHDLTSAAATSPSNPSDPSIAVYGQTKVKFLSVTKICEDFILRKFLVSNTDPVFNSPTSQPRLVYQYQYLAWSDHGVPENVQNTLDFIEHVNNLYKDLNSNKPITVHCSAGIGRTGAIILIDMIIDKIKTYGLQCDIDIFKTVYHLRSQRSGMIQTEKQYQFLYIAIKNFIETYTNRLQSQKRQQQQYQSQSSKQTQPISASASRTSSLQSMTPSSSNALAFSDLKQPKDRAL